jgi:hypothetical protein
MYQKTPESVHQLRLKIYEYIKTECGEMTAHDVVAAMTQLLASMIAAAENAADLSQAINWVIKNLLVNVESIAGDRGMHCHFEMGEYDECQKPLTKEQRKNLC